MVDFSSIFDDKKSESVEKIDNIASYVHEDGKGKSSTTYSSFSNGDNSEDVFNL